jgi:hypothetical protein
VYWANDRTREHFFPGLVPVILSQGKQAHHNLFATAKESFPIAVFPCRGYQAHIFADSP